MNRSSQLKRSGIRRFTHGPRTAALVFASLVAGPIIDAQDDPVIRTSTRLVQVDVTVRNNKGPIRDLTKEDFTIFDKGKPRQISLFTVTEAREQPAAGDQPLAPGVVSNRAGQKGSETPKSVTVILVDRLNTPDFVQPYADRELLRFLQTAQKGDRIAIYVMGQGIRVVQDFTTDPDRLAQAASRINLDHRKDLKSFEMIRELAAMGVNTSALQEEMNFAKVDRATGTSRALSLIAQHLAGIPGRKNLVWISSSFPLVINQGGFHRDFVPEIQRATRMLNEANVVVYPVDARGLMTSQGPTPVFIPSAPGAPANNFSQAAPGSNPNEGIDTMNTIASWTGGKAYYNTNDLKGAIREAIDDADVTYTLGFYVPQETLDGSFHDLRVKVSKGGDVRFRKGYLASAEVALTEKQRIEALRHLFENPLDASTVGLTARAVADPSHPGGWLITLTLDLHDLHIEQKDASWVGSVAVVSSLESMKPPTMHVTAMPIRLDEKQMKTALRFGLTIEEPVESNAKNDRLRMAVQDSTTGAAGSLWIPLETR